MNILRTVQKDEDEGWVKLFFEQGPHSGDNVPDYPPRFPFHGKPQKCKEGDFLYLIYRNQVIGYGIIARIKMHEGIEVGTERQLVSKGGEIELEGALKRMSFRLLCRGFQGIRYTSENLQELEPVAAEAEIRALKLVPNQSRDL